MPDSAAYRELLAFALELARIAAPVLQRGYGTARVARKADGTEVTDADRQAEDLMVQAIARRYPDHAVLGEEFGPAGRPQADWTWVLDPVDGTASFTLGIPLFGTLVGLLHRDDPVVGVIHLPILGESVYGGRGLGCWFQRAGYDPVRVQVQAVSRLEEAVVLAPAGLSSASPPERVAHFQRLLGLMARALKFRFGGDCLQHALVCRGLAHVAVDPVMHPWDIAAVVPCIEEAGGVAASLQGQRERVTFAGSLVTCASDALLAEVLNVLGSVPHPGARGETLPEPGRAVC